MKRLILIATYIFYSCMVAHAAEDQINGGMQFRSYEVAPNLRTSLRIPGNKNSHLKYKSYLSLSFDLKINTQKECFGYICRIILDNKENIDILLTNPANDDVQIVMASRLGGLLKTGLPTGQRLNEWNKVDIALLTEETGTDIIINGARHDLTFLQDHFHQVEVYFGANQSETFSTSDVAPMAVKNISLSTKKNKKNMYFWRLDHEEDLKEGSGHKKMAISTENPEWHIANNSSWQPMVSIESDSKVKIVPDKIRNLIYFITKDHIIRYDLQTRKTERTSFRQSISFNLLTNDFLVTPDGRLIYINPESDVPQTSVFDFDKGEWSAPIKRTRNSKYLHHNTFYNPCDSNIVQMFGYGFHKYSNDLIMWNESTGDFHKSTLDSIPPRYLAAVGISDSLAWIYGGKGNEKGIQEHGVMIYHDLYTLNLKDYSIRKIQTHEEDSMEVATSDLIISDDEKRLTALFYSPNTYQSKLQLKEFLIQEGEMKLLGDAIPYNFLDVESEARLIFDKAAQIYYAVTVQRINNESFRSDIYKINAPVISAGLRTPEKNSNWISAILFLIVGLAISASFYLFIANRKKFRTQDKHEAREEIKEILEPGIYMVGGFRVINRNKEDISASFTPLMKQLLCILVLYSYRHKGGISNTELKEALWDDKSEESYYNNRGVNIKKLRTCLAEVGNIEICTSNGTWSLNIEDSKCDWFRYMKEIESISFKSITVEQICRLVKIASHGPLLSDMRYEWTDRFKAQYTDLMIATLEKVCCDTRHQLSSDMQIHIADAILTFDSLDEAAVKSKCKALITQKRLGIAESTFKNFTQEYNRLMGEEYSVSFNEFVR